MPVKTLNVDMDAYDLLASDKRAGESFSKVVKRRMKGAHTASDLLRNIDRLLLEGSTLDDLDSLVRVRNHSSAKSLTWDDD